MFHPPPFLLLCNAGEMFYCHKSQCLHCPLLVPFGPVTYFPYIFPLYCVPQLHFNIRLGVPGMIDMLSIEQLNSYSIDFFSFSGRRPKNSHRPVDGPLRLRIQTSLSLCSPTHRRCLRLEIRYSKLFLSLVLNVSIETAGFIDVKTEIRTNCTSFLRICSWSPRLHLFGLKQWKQ